NATSRRFVINLRPRCLRAARHRVRLTGNVFGSTARALPFERLVRAIRNASIEWVRIVFGALRLHLKSFYESLGPAVSSVEIVSHFVLDRFPTFLFADAKCAHARLFTSQSNNKVNR